MSDLKCCAEFNNGCEGVIEKRRQNTQYENEESNWVICCESCFEVIQAHWADMWAEYWNGHL